MSEWTLVVGERDWLDGIQSGLMICRKPMVPIAYAFDEGEARLMTAAPTMAEALEPFAVASETAVKINGEPHIPADDDIVPAGMIRWGDLRRAWMALRLAKGEDRNG